MRALAHRIVHARNFEYLLVVLIIGSAVLLGLSTSDKLADQYLIWMGLFWILTILVLVLEVLLKMVALLPRINRYFRDGWNTFDFLTISFLVGSVVVYTSGYASVDYADYAILLMLLRLLRLLGSLSTVQELRLILSTLVRSIPSAGHIILLLGIILYVYAYVGYASFSEYDPVHWGDLGVAVLSLFQVVTMDDWGNIMQTAIEQEPMAWIYFVSFVIISAFIVANLFIAVVISNLEEVMRERRQPRPAEASASRVETLRELSAARQTLDRLEERLQQFPE